MVQLVFTRAATGYWHRVTLPRWKFEKDPGHKKFVVSLVIALKTVIAALQTNKSSRPFSVPAIVMRKTVSLLARNKFVNRDTCSDKRGWHFLISFSYPSYHWKCVLVSATPCILGARGFSCAVSVFRLSRKKWPKLPKLVARRQKTSGAHGKCCVQGMTGVLQERSLQKRFRSVTFKHVIQL